MEYSKVSEQIGGLPTANNFPFDEKEIMFPSEKQFYGCEDMDQNRIVIR